MKIKRSLALHGHATSVALEPVFWEVIDEAVAREACSLAGFIAGLDDQRIAEGLHSGLASYLRVWCVRELRGRLSP